MPSGTTSRRSRSATAPTGSTSPVIVGVVAGIIVGLVAPDLGKSRRRARRCCSSSLIKMMIIAGHLLHGRDRHRQVRKAAAVGKVGGLALVYFLVDVDGRAGHRTGRRQPDQPGHRSQHPRRPGQGRRTGRAKRVRGRPDGVPSSDIIPTTLFSSLTEGNVLQALFVALLVGFAHPGDGRRRRAAPAWRRALLQKLVFKHPDRCPVGRAHRRIRCDRQRWSAPPGSTR